MIRLDTGRPMQSLFWQLFLINGLLFLVGTLLLALSPATVSSPLVLTEIPVLAIGLTLILVANALLIRRSLAPLKALTSVMQRADLLHSGDRISESDSGEFEGLIRTFNEMLDRFEAESSASAAHALAAQEGERQRIARELHDEIGQSLTVALLGLKRVLDRAPAGLKEDLRAAQDVVRGSLDEVRQVAHRLRPGVLEDLGLHSALVSLTTEFARSSGIEVERVIESELPELSNEVELVLYRVAQECLTNVARHSKATRASLTLSCSQRELTLQISDNGIGGDFAESAGIRGMRERAMLIGARLAISALPEGGTEVRLIVPFGQGKG
ncbi:MAG: HAMP domain-containing protein [Cryobacterium sp.]|nr:HAMP domain-containing protein [Cryobacterium sp.]MBX3089219.1 HAMP domain-containing protein [Cryobacterium sp.]MCO5294489.1 histidine kinase [Homoserinimonas sp.]MCW5945184.1 HAMP domain-containing protein [Cryobacterium sp.]